MAPVFPTDSVAATSDLGQRSRLGVADLSRVESSHLTRLEVTQVDLSRFPGPLEGLGLTVRVSRINSKNSSTWRLKSTQVDLAESTSKSSRLNKSRLDFLSRGNTTHGCLSSLHHRSQIADVVPTALHPTPPHSATAMRPGSNSLLLRPYPCVRFPIQCYGDADTYPPAAPLIHELLQCVRSGLGTLASLAPTLSLSCTIGLVLPDLGILNDRNPASHATPSVPLGSSDVPHHAVPHSTTLYATNTPALSPSRSSRSALTPYLSPLFLDPSLPLSLPLPECPMTVKVDHAVSFETDVRVVAHPWNKSFGRIFDAFWYVGEFYHVCPIYCVFKPFHLLDVRNSRRTVPMKTLQLSLILISPDSVYGTQD
ncbi:hypothetical protein B0H13DRAFT_2274850 [Mycena leptocephala]|nr:hypothetical protein B0H13DRAFT_2274850 [Mycena leptocephala]